MNYETLNAAKWTGFFSASFLLNNYIYVWVVVLTFVCNYLYHRNYGNAFSGLDYVKLFVIGALVSLTIFDALRSFIDGDLARAGASSFLGAVAIEVSPILIQVIKEIAPSWLRKKAGVKND